MSSKNVDVSTSSGVQGRLCLKIAPQPDVVRAREPVQRTKGRVVGYYPSVKNNRQIAWESQLEQKACNLFEFSSVVASYREQPITIYFPTGNELCKYTPDFELILTNGQTIYVEVKPAGKLANKRIIERLKDISNFLEKKNHNFIVITDEELNQPTRQRNFNLLRQYLTKEIEEQFQPLIRQKYSSCSKETVESLSNCLGSIGRVYSLMAKGIITFDLDTPIQLSTQLYLSEESKHETCFFSYRVAPNFKRRSLSDRTNP
ncbi:TnsA endonuclease N-terminal domain-containing protein [Pleionea sp. CnH1-48]|uniref:TnsA endonuclease N-terminal domain-containing protein n=1 Tax=Pleionea sp. CnH1-48 TaxID=2954494 RepID=UPI002096B800|nr:TnsA endonuclease N-terminal domain-containing protein [Pleionea sp. CnH1-48]MCO7226632.1 TnsA endonuclease N-terminal domain-containing protein [Pleionea sp. CnH1-48]